MEILRAPEAMAARSRAWRRRGLRVGLVPTMGALHAGHASLVRRARRTDDRVVVSIFVNPLQFGPREDLARYPRTPGADARLCRALGADALWLPEAAAMYPTGFATTVSVGPLSRVLCGRFRPGHFDGVATVVLKLLEAARPHDAFFGEKDYQQIVVVRRMAEDLNLQARIIPCPTVREPDGLALSSRNRYLSGEERSRAPAIYAALRWGRLNARRGARTSPLLAAVRRRLRAIPGATIDYVEAADPATLERPRLLRAGVRLLAAIRLGRTRLIDNVAIL